MEQVTLEIKSRQASTKGEMKKSRVQGMIPGIVYGRNEKALPVWVNEKEFTKLLHRFRENLRIRRMISIEKYRGSDYDEKAYYFDIRKGEGIVILKDEK